ncbi:MAG: metal-dependent hydrolase, partial [Pyrinomonadaceae bacterium]|nr:metal-dependent hydrolase [Pyrinomonadaceae bacterium]
MLARWRRRKPSVRLKGLLLASIVASFTHPLLDWTNNYGVRPFLPWSGRWFYGDLVFIVDPWIWLVLGGAVFLLTSKNWWRTLIWVFIATALSLLVLSPRLENAGLEHATTIRVIWFVALAALALARWFNLAPRWGSRLAHVALVIVLIYWGALSLLH